MAESETMNPHVKTAIEYCGGKQSLLAEKLECAQQTVSKLLLGEIEIDPTWAVRLSRATDGHVKAAEACPALAEVVGASPSTAPQPEAAEIAEAGS
jgi:DNA-binding transcriptional regulator YdaS (Cro superfamily)